MQFPRCIVHSLSSVIIYLLTIGVAILLLGMVPAVASAATPQLACAPTNLSFGQTVVGQTETLPVTLTNTGESSATISAVSANNSGFTPSSLSLPLTLAPGQSVELSVTFTPAARGWTGGTIKFISDATNSILPLQVSGAGVTSEIVTASPSTVTFGSSALGTVSTKPIVLTNARPWKVNLSALQTTGAGFSVSGPTFPYALDPGQSVTLNVDFSPSSAGPVAGILFISGAGLAIPLNGIGAAPGQLIANPASLSFGSVPAGSSATLMDSFTNTGGANVTISQATVAGTGFTVSGLSLPMVLFPGASVTFTAEFAPQGAVSATGGITVVSNASNPTLNVSLSGTSIAQGQLTLAPTALNFGNATVGTSVSQTSSISASGSSVTVSSASLSSAEFSMTGISLPVTIPAGQSVPVTVTFAPQSSGTASAVLSLTSNAANTPSQALSGVGMAPQPQSVSLSWTDGSSGVTGYNVFRSSVSGGPYAQINSALEPTPAFTDSSVVAGQTYYYVTTAVNGSGEQSAYSNQATAVVPNP
jgi:hypothetical protein